MKAKKYFRKKKISLEETTQLAVNGDPRANKFWSEAGFQLGTTLCGLVNLLNPRRIVIGGGVANAPPIFFKTVQITIQKRAMKIPAIMVKIVKARLGDDAGIMGARVLLQER